MIARWNAKVSPGDTVWHLGDFALVRDREGVENLLRRLHGRIHILFGNHDRKQVQQATGFGSKGHYRELKVNGIMYVMSHYCHLVWNKSHHGSVHLHGHSHHTLKYPWPMNAIDVGVDGKGYDFAPLDIEEIDGYIKKQLAGAEVANPDHHKPARRR